MAKTTSIPRPEDLDRALADLVAMRARRDTCASQIETFKRDLENAERQRAELDKEIAARAAALKDAHAKGDFFGWAGA